MAEAISNEGVESMIHDAFDKARKYQDGAEYPETLQADWMETPVGPLLIVGDDERLHLVSFIEQASMVRKAALIQKKLKARIEMGASAAVAAARRELDEYFAGTRRRFEVSLALGGTAFQTRVWEALCQVPYGEIATYADLAKRIGKPAAFRAVAQANAQNPVSIIVPSHRVVNADGGAGGFNSGSDRKRQLLEFERAALGRVPVNEG